MCAVPARFEPAVPLNWSASTDLIINATEYGPVCWQPSPPYFGAPQMDEQCLYLNIFRPVSHTPEEGGANATLLPIMVWVHGGSFVNGAGSDPSFDGAELAVTQGVLVVSINYRLGPLGFMAMDAAGTRGMNGLLDQVLALRWVRQHAMAFGGDPDRVTVFGESAGSLSTCILAVSPAAKGYMNRAILESGACTGAVWSPKNASVGFTWSQWFVKEQLHCDEWADLRNASLYPPAKFAWPSVLDGDAPVEGQPPSANYCVDPAVLPAAPQARYQDASSLNVEAMILGANSFDGLGPWARAKAPSLFPTNATAYAGALQMRFGPRASAVANAYPASAYNGSVPAAFVQMDGDDSVLCPTKALGAVVASHLPNRTFLYVYAHLYGADVSAQSGLARVGVNTSTWASHASEIPFVFGTQTFISFPNRSKSLVAVPFTAAERNLSQAISSYWGAFARGTSMQLVASGQRAWPAVSSAPSEPQLSLKLATPAATLLQDYHAAHCASFGEA
jgi:para-nitrobenzyl esterase